MKKSAKWEAIGIILSAALCTFLARADTLDTVQDTGMGILACCDEIYPNDPVLDIRNEYDIYPGPNQFVPREVEVQMIRRVKPVPADSVRNLQIPAKIWVKVLVDRLGENVTARIIKCEGNFAIYEKAALEAAIASQFQPAISEGRPITWWSMPIKYEFGGGVDH